MNIKRLRGFTIVEMLIIVPIVIIMIGIFITAIISMTGDVLASRANNVMAFSIQDALTLIEQDVNLSGGYLATNNITLTSPQGYDDDTTNFHNADATTGPMLILNTYTTTSNPLNSSREIVYKSSPNPCASSQKNQNDPLMMNVIYFIKDNTLWRRVVVPSNYAVIGCSIPWQQPSCAPGVTDVICKSKDMKLVENIQSGGFEINYYPNLSSESADTVAGDNTKSDADRLAALRLNNTVRVTINATSTIAGRDVSQSGTILAVSPNDNISTTTEPGLLLSLDAGNLSSYAGSGTTWTDLSANANGTLEGGVGYSPNYGGVLTFNGSNQFVDTSLDPFLPLIGNAYTISVWVKDDTTVGNLATHHRVISFNNVTTNIQLSLSPDITVTNRVFYIKESADMSIKRVTAGNASSGWHYVVATSDGAGNWLMYLDGSPSDGGTTISDDSTPLLNAAYNKLYIGQRGNGGYVLGSISNVNIYNRALTATEVSQNYNALRGRFGL